MDNLVRLPELTLDQAELLLRVLRRETPPSNIRDVFSVEQVERAVRVAKPPIKISRPVAHEMLRKYKVGGPGALSFEAERAMFARIWSERAYFSLDFDQANRMGELRRLGWLGDV